MHWKFIPAEGANYHPCKTNREKQHRSGYRLGQNKIRCKQSFNYLGRQEILF